MYWGNPNAPSAHLCSYRELRRHAYFRWEKTLILPALDEPNLVRMNAVQGASIQEWKTARKATLFSAKIQLQRPDVQVSFQAPVLQRKPTTKFSWEAVAWTAAGIALLAISVVMLALLGRKIFFFGKNSLPVFLELTAWLVQGVAKLTLGVFRLIFDLVSPNPIYPRNQNAVTLAFALLILYFIGTLLLLCGLAIYVAGIIGHKLLSAARVSFMPSIYSFLLATKAFSFNRGPGQMILADQFMNEAVTEPNSNLAKDKIQQALGWYQQAALNGHTPAQRRFGLGLLASLPPTEARFMEDPQLMLVKEGIQWLQAAAIHGDKEALQDLRLLFKIAKTEPGIQLRIHEGVAGTTEIERIKNLFPPGHHFVDIAVTRFASTEANENKRNKIRWTLFEPRRAPRIQPICDIITSPEFLGQNPFPRDLAHLIEDYDVGFLASGQQQQSGERDET